MPDVISDNEERSTALDALFTEATGEKPERPSAPDSPAKPSAPPGSSAGSSSSPASGAQPAGAPEPSKQAPAATGGGPAGIDIKPKAPAAPAPGTAPVAPAAGSAQAAGGIASAGVAGAGAAGAPAASADSFDTVELPPYSKPKSVEAFSKVKELARQTITAKDAEITRLNAEISQRDEKLKGVLPPEAAKELEDLRTFRRSVDIENDPEFKKQFDTRIASNNNAIVGKLVEAGMTKEQMDKIKELGGPEQVDWDVILPKLPAQARRFIEAKLVANEDLRGERKIAVEQARKDPTVFEKQRVETQAKTIYETANTFLSGLAWTAEHPIPPNAKPEDKTRLEAENAFAKETQGRLTEALKDFSPARFAELAVGTAMAFKFKKDFEASEAQHKATQVSLDAVTKERDALRAELEKIKNAGQTHRRTSAIPPAAPVNRQFESGLTALDRLREEVTAT